MNLGVPSQAEIRSLTALKLRISFGFRMRIEENENESKLCLKGVLIQSDQPIRN